MFWLFLIPLACALTGCLIVQFLLIILFHPYKPRKVLGIRIQGILPSQQPAMAKKTAQSAAAEFLSSKLIQEKVTDPAQVQKIMPVIEEHVDHFLRNKLKKEMPMVGMLIGEKTIGSLKKVFLAELENMFPAVI